MSSEKFGVPNVAHDGYMEIEFSIDGAQFAISLRGNEAQTIQISPSQMVEVYRRLRRFLRDNHMISPLTEFPLECLALVDKMGELIHKAVKDEQ